MEAEILDAQLLHELEARVHLGLGVGHGALLRPEGLVRRVPAEHVRTAGAQVVPPGHGEGQVLLHGLAQDDTVRVVELEGQGVLTLRPLVGDDRDVLKNLFHGKSPLFDLLK